MNGEVAQALSLDTTPTITADEAVESAKQGMVKWYGGEKADYEPNAEAELWVFDEKLLRPSIRPAELVWRLELIPADESQPIRELILVNAEDGNVPLHFNQIDTTWHTQQDVEPTVTPTPTEIPTEPVATETPVPTATPMPEEPTIPSATPIPTDEIQVTPTPETLPTEVPGEIEAQTATTYYVNGATGDDSNTCITVDAPCQHIQQALEKGIGHADGDIVYVASGTYTWSNSATHPNFRNVVIIDRGVMLSGGWNTDFTVRNGVSVIDGSNTDNGILANSGNTTIEYFVIQNAYTADGGGIYIYVSNLTLRNSTLKNNIATGRGAGIHIQNGTLTATNSTISGNGSSSTIYGGGIYANSGAVRLTNTTIAYNTASYGGGISRNTGSYTIKNTIIANNTASNAGPDCGGAINSLSYSILGDRASCSVPIGEGNQFNIDPKISSTLNGPKQVHALLADSPAIDAGTSTDCPTADQIGTLRPQGSACDIGAYEYRDVRLPTSIDVHSGSPQGTSLSFSFASLLTAIVTDEYGIPISGIEVTFTAPASGASGTFADTSSNVTTATTDVYGLATAPTFAANSIVGNYVVVASISGVGIPAAFELENVVPIATSIMTESGTPQSVLITEVYESPLKVLVKDQFANPMPGITVTFTAPATGAGVIFAGSGTNEATAITDAGGIATTSMLTANGTSGIFTVNATVGGIASPASFQLTNNQTWYISTTGNDSNACSSSATPCATVVGVLGKTSFVSGDIIKVSDGTYTIGSAISKNVNISGGWSGAFDAQSGHTYINNEVIISPNFRVKIGNFNVTNGRIHNSGNLTLERVAIYKNNLPDNGAGIYQNQGSLILNNVTISNNTVYKSASSGSSLSGGGIYVKDGTVTINNSTITQNTVLDNEDPSLGGGIANPNNKPLTITNSIIAGNIADRGTDCYGQVASGGNNLLGSQAECTFTRQLGDQIGIQDLGVNPMLGNLQDNGGATLTHALLTGSSAIDNGNPLTCTATDQRGIARPQGTACDIGAFEGSVSQTVSGLIRTYTSGNSESYPGTLVCDETTADCASASSGDQHVVNAHQNAIGIYEFYLARHNRFSFDNSNGPVVSTVHYKTNYNNAFWSGMQMVYGDARNWPMADDVVAHELTHGVTNYESNLFYFYQSGAINESFSDLWGEYYDQSNGIGTDTEAVKWLHGEDTASNGTGANRSMSNPPQFNDPDKMSSSYYVKTDDDNGGVHSNSGVNNKAVFLLVDGGAFNGQTIASLGWEKTAAIYYEAQTNLLFSGADYSDLYYVLQQACTNLSATNFKGITSGDCVQVKKALDAVQMNLQPAPNFHMEAAVCPTGQATAAPITLFSDDFENGTASWTAVNYWSLEDFYATSPTHNMYGDDSYTFSYSRDNTSTLSMKNAVTLPTGTSYLYFKHAFAFEYYKTYYFDGAVLEYSIDNGANWLDAKPLFSSGKNYTGTIYLNWVNPLRGRSGFVGDSHGYVSSRYNLISLAGKSVKFRWKFAIDDQYHSLGWFLDDVKIYTCVGYPSIPAYTAPADKALTTDYTPLLNWSDATPNLHHYQVQVATDSAFSTLVEEADNLPTSQYTVSSDLPSNTTYYWRVRSFNAINETKGWTAPRSFRTALTPPVLTPLTLPLTDNRPTFDWSDVLDTTNYTLQVSTSSAFASPAVNATVNGSIYTPDKDLPAGKTLYWRVRSNGANGPSGWATSSTNFNSANPPSVPVLATPLDKALTTNYQPKLDWNNATTPLGVTLDGYQLQVATDTAFSSVVLNQNVTDKTGIIPTVVSEFTLSTPLAENTTYYWRVRSYNSSGQYSAWSLVRSIRTALPAPTLSPSSLPENGKALDSNKPTFNWDDVPGATGYTLQVSTLNTFKSFVLNQKTFASTFTPVKDFPANKTLYWRVIATGANGPTLPSNSFTFTTANPPPMPVLSAPLNNALGSNAPKLDWANVVAPAGVTLDGYQVQLATDPAFSLDIQTHDATDKAGSPLAVVSEFTPSALTQNTKYYWHVRSFDDKDGDLVTTEDRHYSSWSLTRSFRMIIPAPVLDVLALPADNATATLRRPFFDWSDVPGATGYTIQISTVNTFASTLVKTNTTASNFTPTTDLPANKTLFWRVIANGANGPSLPSNYFTFTTANPPPMPVLSAPVDNAFVTNTLTPKLDWANVVAPAGITLGGYQLQVATDSGFSSIVLTQDVTDKVGTPATVLSEFTLPTLTADTKYFWRVRSFDSGNHYSSWSLVRSFRMVMPAPTLVSPTGSVQTNRPTFDWDDVPNATGYTLQVSTVNTFASFVLKQNTVASVYTPIKDLPANKTLFWRVIANGANGPSLPSASLSITTAATPSIPLLSAPVDNLLVTDTLTPKLDWTNSTVPAGVTFGKYQLEVATDSGFSSIVLTQDVSGGPTVSEFTLTTPLSPNTKYYWRVRSFSSAGNFSGWSLNRSFRIPMTTATLVSPSGTLPISDPTPTFEWDDVPGATYYSIQISTTSTFTTTLVNTTVISSTFTPATNLPANTLLFWRVMAQGPNGPSKWSAYYSFSLQ